MHVCSLRFPLIRLRPIKSFLHKQSAQTWMALRGLAAFGVAAGGALWRAAQEYPEAACRLFDFTCSALGQAGPAPRGGRAAVSRVHLSASADSDALPEALAGARSVS